MLNENEIVKIFKDTKVMLEGHFLLTSGRHSDKYMQCARLFEYPNYSEMLSRQVAELFQGFDIDLVVGPAIGGIIMAYEVARQLKVKNVFAERQDGVMTLRRGFSIPAGSKVLVTEDVVTTGGSVREVMAVVEKCGATVVGVGSMVDRSNGKADFGVPFKPVYRTEVVSFEQSDCPLCKAGKIPAIKPGSRASK